MEEGKIFCPEFIPFYIEEVRKFELSPTEGLVYGFMRFYSKLDNKGFFFKSEDLAGIIKVSSGTVDNCVSILEKKGLIKRETSNIGFKKVRKIFLNFDEIGSSSYDEVLNLTIGGTSILTKKGDKIRINKNNNNKENNKKENIKEKILILGELENVKLREEEKNKLLENYGKIKTEEFIEKLSLYIGAKGDKYKSHYAVILNWIKKDNVSKINETQKTNLLDLL